MTIVELTAVEVFALAVAANVHAALFGLVLWHAPGIWRQEQPRARLMLGVGLAMLASPVVVAYMAMA